MRQHLIDLLPEELRQRSLAGVRTGRTIAAFVLAIVMLVVLWTHSHVRLTNARQTLDVTTAQANKVIECEQQAQQLRESLDQYDRLAALYDQVALPIELSRVMATIASELPESLTLDRLDVIVQTSSNGPAPVSGSRRSQAPGLGSALSSVPRFMIVELSGLATTDQVIAGFVERLEKIPPLERVSLDYIRPRKVYEEMVQEFRLSFRISLDRQYIVADKESPEGTIGIGQWGMGREQ